MTVTLSPPQKIAIDASTGQPLKIIDDRTATEYLLVPMATVREWLGSLTESELLVAQSEAAGRAGWDDPIMDDYDRYDDVKRAQHHDSR